MYMGIFIFYFVLICEFTLITYWSYQWFSSQLAIVIVLALMFNLAWSINIIDTQLGFVYEAIMVGKCLITYSQQYMMAYISFGSEPYRVLIYSKSELIPAYIMIAIVNGLT